VGNILRRHNLAPAPERSRTTTWKEFLQSHIDVLAGADFFTVEVLTLARSGDVLRTLLHRSRQPPRMVGRHHAPPGLLLDGASGAQCNDGEHSCRYLLHDRDQKFCREFRETLAAGGVKCIPIPARSPKLNAHPEHWVRSTKEECLSKLILFGENSLRRVVSDFLGHYLQGRNHQGKDNLLLFPTYASPLAGPPGRVRCRERLGGLLKYYSRAA
jgi:putative transposase